MADNAHPQETVAELIDMQSKSPDEKALEEQRLQQQRIVQAQVFLENEVSQTLTPSKELYDSVVNFLKFAGDSKILGEWLRKYHMDKGRVAAPYSGTPRVSVIIPCFNYGEYLRECVDSVLQQLFIEFEIIIINDGSTDNTHEVASQILADYPDHKIRYIQQQNMGIVQPRNRGVTVAKGEYILPIDADDIIAPDFLSRTVPVLEQHPEFAYVSTKTLFFGDKNHIWPPDEFDPLRLIISNQQTNTTLYRKAMWKDIGGYDERMTNGFMDWEYWIRATSHGWLGTQIDEPLFFYRRKNASVVTKAKNREAEIKKQIIKLHPELYDSAKLRLCGEELLRSNWIPPVLLRQDIHILPRSVAKPVEESAEVTEQAAQLKKKVLAVLSQLAPAFKDEFSRPNAGTGELKKFAALYKQVAARSEKLQKAGHPVDALKVVATLFALYPLEVKATVLFLNALTCAGDISTTYSVATFYLSIWKLDKDILRCIAYCVCVKAEKAPTKEISFGFFEGAALLAPDFPLPRLKAREIQAQAAGSGLSQASEPEKHVWYVVDSFGYEGGGVNGVSQAKFMTLGSLLANSDICSVSVISPLVPELATGLAEFSEQYNNFSSGEAKPWPDWCPTVPKSSGGELVTSQSQWFSGEHTPCSLPKHAPDLIILEGVRRLPYDYFRKLGITVDCPLAYIHHASPEQFSEKFTDSGKLETMLEAVGEFDINICVSENTSRKWRELPETASSKWLTIHNSVREKEIVRIKEQSPSFYRKRLTIPDGDFVVCCLASIQHRKGQDLLVEQMQQILQEVPSARVLFVGPSLNNWGGKKILTLAEGKPYADRLHFVGPKSNALEYLYASDLMVLPSREEALPLSILEAMALGKPCVASDVNGIPEMVVHNETGLLFSHDEQYDLARYIIRLALSDSEREKMAAKSERRYAEYFSKEKHNLRWREVLQEIL